MSKKIGITGNIGSGKSTVSHIFELLGIPIYVADIEARKFQSNRAIINKIASIAGTEILNNEKQIDRGVLAKILFSNQEKLNAVNKIIHPLVISDYEKWHCKNQDAPFTLFESAIIFEHQLESNFDLIIEVYCPLEIAISRASIRDKQPISEIKNRLAHQVSFEKRESHADFVIMNDEKHSILAQVLKIFNSLS